MKFELFRHWKIQNKIMSITVMSMSIMLAGLFFYLLPMLEGKIMEEKQAATRHIVELAMGILVEQDALVKAGTLTLEQSQKEAIEHISKLRYGGKEYLWINDLNAVCIMHPIKPELNGKDLSGMKDANGVFIFREFVKVCNEKGEGFVNYMWPKPGEKEAIPKTSYVKNFAPWGWILGSGIYIDDVHKDVNEVKWLFLGLSLFVAIVSLLLAYSVSRGITRTLGKVDRTLHDMSTGEGDLTRRLEVERNDETGSLATSLNRFLDNMKEIMERITRNAMEVAAAATQLTQTAENIARGTEKVSEESGSVAIATEQMAATSASISNNCATAVENVTRAGHTAKDGAAIVGNAVETIQRIAGKVQESAQTVASLGSRSEQIGDIVGTIEDIADQTNLLALNAAIEAARAGEQGRGFAVVADEVRALAERTTKATREIAEMIKTIQRETASAVAAMEEGVQEVQLGTEDAARSGHALEEILAQVGHVTRQIDEIAVAAKEQTGGTNDISRNMLRISEVVLDASNEANEAAMAAKGLEHMADDLKMVVGQFRL